MSKQKPAEAVQNGDGPALDLLPVETFREAAPYLRRPFTAQAVKFKVQATWPKSEPHTALVVPYIDARLVIDRLNTVIPNEWTARYERDGQAMWCYLEVGHIVRCDIGEGTGKALVSDALKRAAKHFGIGVSLNAMPKLTLKGQHVRPVKTAKGPSLLLTDEGDEHCRDVYAKWLGEAGQVFGEPLDHGDAAGSIGAPDEEPQEDAGSPPMPVEGPEAEKARERVRTAYAALRGLDKTVVPPAQFQQWVNEADTDLDRLHELGDVLEAKLDTVRKESERQPTAVKTEG